MPSESATYECRLDGSAWTSCGWWPYDVSGLADGEHDFDVRAIDDAGNVDATPATWHWTVDTQPPRTTISAGPDAVGSGTRELAFAADEPATFECQMDGSDFAPCATDVTYSGLGGGDHEFVVRATDTAGNSGGATRKFTIGTSPPTPPTPPTMPTVKKPVTPPPADATPRLSAAQLARHLARGTAAVLSRTSRTRLRKQPLIELSASEPGATGIKVVAGKGRSTFTFARVQATFTAAGARRVRLRLTSAGRRALARRGTLKLLVRATITPASGGAVTAKAAARV